MKFKKLNKLFLSYFGFYLLLFLIPLFLLVIFINNQYVKLIHEFYYKDVESSLSATISTVDSNFLQLSKIAIETAITDKVNAANTLPNVQRSKETIAEVGRIRSSIPFAELAIVHFEDSPFVYGPNGTMPYYLFKDFFLGQANAALQEEALHSLVKMQYFPTDDYKRIADFSSQSYILFMHSLCKTPYRKYGTLLCYISPEYLLRLLGQREIVIFDNQEQMIFDSIAYRHADDAYESIVYQDYVQNTIIEIQGVSYLGIKTASLETGLKFLCFTNITDVNDNLSIIRRNLLWFCLMICVLAIVLIVVAMNKNYRPLQNLLNYANNLDHTKAPKTTVNDLKETLQLLSSENGSLKTDSAQAVVEYALTALLKGQFSTVEELAARYGTLFDLQENDSFVVAVLLLPDSQNSVCIEALQRIGQPFFHVKYKSSYEPNKYVMIAWDHSFTEDTLRAALEAYQLAIAQALGTQTILYVGKIVMTLKDIPLSYVSAVTTLDYRVVRSEECLLLYSDIFTEQDDLGTLPYHELDELKKKLKQGMTADVERIFSRILKHLKNCDLSLFLVRGFCFELISSIYQVTKSMDVLLLPNNGEYNDYAWLAEFNTIDELSQNVTAICHTICERIKNSKEFSHETQIGKMKSYIRQNYSDCNFSVQMMADHFEMSLTNISQYFKNHTKQNISECVYYYRIEKAKELLATDANVSEIAASVGYYNVSSFTRRFKQYTGLSPKEFAKQCSKQPVSL